MPMFSHPLARDAKVWRSVLRDGSSHSVLVIVTTLELDESRKTYKKDRVDRLKQAAEEWLAGNDAAASGYLLQNRVKDW